MTKNEIREAIREKVLMSVIPPGTWVDEEALAREFHVSRTPIREICMFLAAERVLEHHPGQGTQTPRIDLGRVRAMVEMAKVLYPRMHIAASKRLAGPERETLEDLLAQIETVADVGKAAERVRLYRLFLATCAEFSGNEFMAWFGSAVAFEECRVLHHVALLDEGAGETREAIRGNVDGFARILDAMCGKDEDKLERAVLARLTHSRQTYLTAIGL